MLVAQTAAQLEAIQFLVAQDGLKARTRDYAALEIARELVRVAEGGLDRMASAGEPERLLLEPVKELLASGETLADRLVAEWGAHLSHEQLHGLLMATRAG